MRFQFAYIALVLLLSVSHFAGAHSGRTDENGGHYDRTDCTNPKYHSHKTEDKTDD